MRASQSWWRPAIRFSNHHQKKIEKKVLLVSFLFLISHQISTNAMSVWNQGLEHRVKEIIGQRPQLLPLRDRTGHTKSRAWGVCVQIPLSFREVWQLWRLSGKTALHYCADNLAPICPSLLLAAQVLAKTKTKIPFATAPMNYIMIRKPPAEPPWSRRLWGVHLPSPCRHIRQQVLVFTYV